MLFYYDKDVYCSCVPIVRDMLECCYVQSGGISQSPVLESQQINVK